jgi:predicted metal-binding membrane protein
VSGIVAYALALAGDELAEQSMWLMDNAARIGGVVLIAAGLYQLSPLKNVCLSKCRSPISFILNSWRDGYGGSFRMGLEHGVYCLGCCWLLFVILFPLGMMNIAVLAGITALIFAEKSTAWGRQIATLAAIALIAYGALVILVPEALPMMMDDEGMAMGDMEQTEMGKMGDAEMSGMEQSEMGGMEEPSGSMDEMGAQ